MGGGQDEDRIIMDRIETQQKWISRVKEIFMTGGKNNDASVNWEEFTKAILSKRNRMLLRELELDVDFANPRAIFSLFDGVRQRNPPAAWACSQPRRHAHQAGHESGKAGGANDEAAAAAATDAIIVKVRDGCRSLVC